MPFPYYGLTPLLLAQEPVHPNPAGTVLRCCQVESKTAPRIHMKSHRFVVNVVWRWRKPGVRCAEWTETSMPCWLDFYCGRTR